jgi:glycosyltransferase involved in cell wall biosynthesis
MIPNNEDSGKALYPELSLVVPMYNEKEMIDLFFERISGYLKSTTDSYEIICINDGSKDETWQLLLAHQKKNSRIKAVSRSRNFGKEIALTAGLDLASGKAVIPLDCDLQDPPELIGTMVMKWREGFDVVLARRVDRSSDSAFKRATSSIFYKMMTKVSDITIPMNVGDFRLLDRKVVEALHGYKERSRFMKGIFASLGFKTITVDYTRPERAAGKTKWNYYKLYKLAIDGFVSFTTLPLLIWSYLGIFISFISFSYGFFLVLRTLLYGIDVPGYASLMVVVLFMSGIILISLGVIGEYLARIFIEVKGRPLYTIMEKAGFGPDQSDSSQKVQ